MSEKNPLLPQRTIAIISGKMEDDLFVALIAFQCGDHAVVAVPVAHAGQQQHMNGVFLRVIFTQANGRYINAVVDIHSRFSMQEILKLYPTLHEADEEKAVDTLNNMIKTSIKPAKLQQQRKRCGYTQKRLAEISGVNLRTLQQYELKAKDIDKASVQTVLALSNALGCGIEDIIEYSA